MFYSYFSYKARTRKNSLGSCKDINNLTLVGEYKSDRTLGSNVDVCFSGKCELQNYLLLFFRDSWHLKRYQLPVIALAAITLLLVPEAI
jgi:hypothetical protein